MPRKDVLVLRQKQSRSFGLREWTDANLGVLRVASERWGRGTERPGHRTAHHTLFLVREGSLRWGHAGQRLGAGSVVWAKPGEARLLACPDEACWLTLVSFTGRDAHAQTRGAFGERSWLRPPEPEAVMSRFDALLREALRGGARDHEACALWLRLLLLELGRAAEATRGPGGETSSRYRFLAARTWLVEQRGRVASLESEAARLGMSHAHLCRLFRRHEGVTPREFAMKLRIQAAAEDLAGGRATVAAVAERAGFADAFSFSRAFKRVMGEPPSRYAARYL